MNTQKIARSLLHRRNIANPNVMPGMILADIGADSMQEALQRRWLVPNTDTGMLQVSNDLQRVHEMRKIAEKCPACQKTECACQVKESIDQAHQLVIDHVGIPPTTFTVISELLSPGTGHDSGQPMRPVAPTAPPASQSSKQPEVGDEVLVAENGKTFSGRVNASNNGRFRVSFGNERPSMERDYAENELRLTNKIPTTGLPR